MEQDKKEHLHAEMKNVPGSDIVLFIKNLCLTFSHLTYYPPTHPVTVKQMQEAWNELLPVLEKVADVSISMAEGKVLFSGVPVEERNPAASKFSKHFEVLRIRGIKFRKGLTYDEFAAFFIFLCKDPQSIIDAGGVDEILKDKNIRHISFNTSVYREISEEETVKRKDERHSGKKGGGADAPKPARKISRAFSPLAVRIQHKLDTEFGEINEIDRLKLLDYLNNIFVKETKKIEEKNNELQDEINEIRQIVQNVEDIFDDTNLGFILVDRKQKVCFIEHGNIIPYDLMLNEPLPNEFLEKLADFDDSTPLKIDSLTIMQVAKDSKKRIKGILFQFE